MQGVLSKKVKLSTRRELGLEDRPQPPIPEKRTLESLRGAVQKCRACPLWKRATQAVFGEGSTKAKAIFIGEQPGFDEDLAGKPFVGPAGKLLDRALEQAGISRQDLFVTNMVKHFKWESKGQQHMHKKPNVGEVAACSPWLEAELELIKPKILVCLGATAAQGLLGKDFRVSRQRGQWVKSSLAGKVMATVHPSSILRTPDSERRHAEMARFIEDLKEVAKALRALS